VKEYAYSATVVDCVSTGMLEILAERLSSLKLRPSVYWNDACNGWCTCSAPLDVRLHYSDGQMYVWSAVMNSNQQQHLVTSQLLGTKCSVLCNIALDIRSPLLQSELPVRRCSFTSSVATSCYTKLWSSDTPESCGSLFAIESLRGDGRVKILLKTYSEWVHSCRGM